MRLDPDRATHHRTATQCPDATNPAADTVFRLTSARSLQYCATALASQRALRAVKLNAERSRVEVRIRWRLHNEAVHFCGLSSASLTQPIDGVCRNQDLPWLLGRSRSTDCVKPGPAMASGTQLIDRLRTAKTCHGWGDAAD